MPKKIDPALRERAVRLVREHRSEYPSLTAASAGVARQVGVGNEPVRRWVLQADIGTSRSSPKDVNIKPPATVPASKARFCRRPRVGQETLSGRSPT